MFQAFQTELRARWKLVLLLAVLAAVALIGEKAVTKAPIIKSTTLYVEEDVRIHYDGQEPGSSDYMEFFASYGSLIAFARESGQTFDYEKFQPGWNAMDDEAKAKWLKKHFLLNDATPEAFCAALFISETEWKDAAYAKENGTALLEAYIRFQEQRLQRLGLPVTFEHAAPVELLPQEVQVSQRSLAGKYGIIGAVLGALAGLVIVLVLAVRKRHA